MIQGSISKSTPSTCKIVTLLAAQRSGTHMLGSVLNTHPAIQSLDEVLNPDPLAAKILPLRYHIYLAERAGNNPDDCLPSHGRTLFNDYLDRIETTFADLRYALLDIKYDQLYQVPVESQDLLEPPPVLKTLFIRKAKIIHLVRRNILKGVVSDYAATASGRYAAFSEEEQHRSKIHIETDTLLRDLQRRKHSIEHATEWFQLQPKRTFCVYYEDLCDFNSSQHFVSPEPIRQLADFLGIDNNFSLKPHILKQTSNRLEDVIENYEEVVETLSGTEFEQFLASPEPPAVDTPTSWKTRLASFLRD